MPLFIQKIPHLLFGVSQRPNVLKDPSQLQSCDNWIARAAYGLAKRPAFAWLGKLTSSLTGIDGATIFSIQRDEDDRYRVIIQNGTIKVFDMFNGGNEVTVKDFTTDSYKTDSVGAGYRHVTVGDTTFVANRGVTVAKGTDNSDTQAPYAIVTVEQADFATLYEVTLNGKVFTFQSAVQGDSTSRGQINTQEIASGIYDELTRGIWDSTRMFQITRYGSSIYIDRKFGADFKIDVFDGLADVGLRLIKGKITDPEDLQFSRAPHGTKVLVTGDPSVTEDDFWMVYDATGSDPEGGSTKGVWRETVAPNVLLDLDAETMPHKLSFQATVIEGVQTMPALAPGADVQSMFSSTSDGGWTEDEAGGAVTEEDDDLITVQAAGRRRLIPGADGTTRQLAEIKFDLDTARVDYGKDVIVNLIHRTTGGTETTLARKRYEPGETSTVKSFAVTADGASEGIWLATDRFKITLEYGDGIAPTVGSEAQLTMVGGAVGAKADLTPRYIPIRVYNLGGVLVTFNGTGDAYREGTQVAITMGYTDIVDTFSITIPAGGYTKYEVAIAMAAYINTDPGVVDYTAVQDAETVRIYVTAAPDADPVFTDVQLNYQGTKVYIDETFVSDEFIGETVRNLNSGTERTITGNTTDGVFSLDGGGFTTVGDRFEVIGSGGYFTWGVGKWDDRIAGDEDTNEWPSFVGTTVRDIFFYRNRLGIVAGRGVSLSSSGDVENFFRTSIQQLLDGDRIDVESAHGDVAIFHSAIGWNNTLYLWTDNAQYELYGEPVLTPRTVRLDVVSRYFNTPTARPLVLGPRLYFAHSQTGSGKIMEWLPPTDQLSQYMARDITMDVPTYLPGAVLDIAGDYAHGILGVIVDGDQDSVYIWSFQPKGDGTNVYEAWQRWTLPAGSTARQLDFADGKLAIIYSYTDGVYLDEADMDQTIDGGTEGFIDRRVSSGDSGVSAVSAAGVDPITLSPEFQYMFEQAQGYADNDDITSFLDTVPETTYTIVEHADTQHFSARAGGPVQDRYAEIRSIAMLEDVNGGDTLDLHLDFTCFAVVRIPSLTSQNAHPIFSIFQNSDNGQAAGEFNWVVQGNDEASYNTGEIVFARPYVEDPVITGTPTLMPANTWVVLSIRMTSRDCRIFINDVECTHQVFTADGTTNPALRIGAFRSQFFTAHADMDMAFLNAYDSALTTQQMTDVFTYLHARYVVAAGGDTTDITFPYPVLTDETEGVVTVWDKDTGAEITRDATTPRPTTTTVRVAGDESATSFDVGIAFTARARLAPIYFRTEAGTAETGGRTQIRELQVEFNNTENLKVEATPEGRSKQTVAVSYSSPTEGRVRVPVLTRGETAIIELVSDESGDARVNSIDIELQHTNRSRRA